MISLAVLAAGWVVVLSPGDYAILKFPPLSRHSLRVIGAIEGGMSRNGAARRFGVSIASAVRWMDEYLRCGRTAPKPRGGDRRSGRIEAQADLLMRAIEETPDITLMELREKLIAERGESFAISTLHAFYRRHEVTFKKRLPTPANKSARM